MFAKNEEQDEQEDSITISHNKVQVQIESLTTEEETLITESGNSSSNNNHNKHEEHATDASLVVLSISWLALCTGLVMKHREWWLFAPQTT